MSSVSASALVTIASPLRGVVRSLIDRLPEVWQRGITTWRARLWVALHDTDSLRLHPIERLKTLQMSALNTLIANGGRRQLGDYLEFGVFAGSSLTCMYESLSELGLDHVRLFGFDSFEGLPAAAQDEPGGWTPGEFKFEREVTEAILAHRGVDMSRVELVKGWYSETLTPALRTRLGLRKVSVVMIDCDLYASTVSVLRFIEPLIADRAVLFFDDWNANDAATKNQGEKRALDEFLSAHPELEVDDFGSYAEHARCFVIRRVR